MFCSHTTPRQDVFRPNILGFLAQERRWRSPEPIFIVSNLIYVWYVTAPFNRWWPLFGIQRIHVLLCSSNGRFRRHPPTRPPSWYRWPTWLVIFSLKMRYVYLCYYYRYSRVYFTLLFAELLVRALYEWAPNTIPYLGCSKYVERRPRSTPSHQSYHCRTIFRHFSDHYVEDHPRHLHLWRPCQDCLEPKDDVCTYGGWAGCQRGTHSRGREEHGHLAWRNEGGAWWFALTSEVYVKLTISLWIRKY